MSGFGNLQTWPRRFELPANVLLGANEGLSVSGTNAQLGQLAAGLAGPAALSASRNIPVGSSIITFTTNRVTPVGGGIRLLSALAGTGMNSVHFEALNVNQTGVITSNNTLTTLGSTPAWRVSGGNNNVFRGFHIQPDFRPTGGDQKLRVYSAQPNIVSSSGAGPYSATGYYHENAIVNNAVVGLEVRGFHYNISTAYSGAGTVIETAFENTQGDNFFNSDSFGFGAPGKTRFGFARASEFAPMANYLVGFGDGVNNGQVYFLSNTVICATFKSGIGLSNNAMHIGMEGVDLASSGLTFFGNAGAAAPAFRIAQSGSIRCFASLFTGAPSGGTLPEGAWRLGQNVATVGATMDTANYLEVSVGGVLKKLALIV